MSARLGTEVRLGRAIAICWNIRTTRCLLYIRQRWSVSALQYATCYRSVTQPRRDWVQDWSPFTRTDVDTSQASSGNHNIRDFSFPCDIAMMPTCTCCAEHAVTSKTILSHIWTHCRSNTFIMMAFTWFVAIPCSLRRLRHAREQGDMLQHTTVANTTTFLRDLLL